jgi:hypothetical protein
VLSPGTYLDTPPGPLKNDHTSLAYAADVAAPAEPAYQPAPFNGLQNVGDSLEFGWNGGMPCTSRDFYVGTTNPPPLSAGGISCDSRPGLFTSPASTYYWRIDTHKLNSLTPSQVWRFSTGGTPNRNIVMYPTDFNWRVLTSPWLLAADPTGTSGDSAMAPRVFQTDDKGWDSLNAPPNPASNYVDVRFWTQPNVPYHVWLRMRAQDDSKWNDSVWVQFENALVDGQPAYRIGSSDALLVNLENCFACGVDGWGWQDRSWWLNQSATVTFEGYGEHAMRIMLREDGVSVDQIVLSPSQFLTSPPGPVKADRTIVAKP